ncbi:MAG TPA: DUF58 domain-containing protein [Thermoanaerobaculia bacterium]|nr:DUF58 domain-containing protein [Thermoanaerobaculia bacterium]
MRTLRRRVVPEGIRITKVGLWYVLLTVFTGIAATNTGNNALYMVFSMMLASLVVSGIASRHNVRALELEVEPPREVYAKSPFHLRFRLRSRGVMLPRWFLLLSLEKRGQPMLVPYLPRRGSTRGELEVLVPRRGRHQLEWGHVSSLFPFGFFRKGARHRLEAEVLVFPEIFPSGTRRAEPTAPTGRGPARRSAWGHDLHTLREFRQGDDPRGIHWKQSARTGELVYIEREVETGHRLSILFDNGVGPLVGETAAERFESLVSEAATAAVEHLGRGFHVELVTRDRRLGFATGQRQKLAILEALALLEPVAPAAEPLQPSDSRAALLRLALEHEVAA